MFDFKCLVTPRPSRKKALKAEHLFFAMGNGMEKQNIDCNNALGPALKYLTSNLPVIKT